MFPIRNNRRYGYSRATFLFWFENKRILNEARRRNQFVDIAEKRWVISKIIYISIILFSLIVSFLLIQGDLNFLEKKIFSFYKKRGFFVWGGDTTFSLFVI